MRTIASIWVGVCRMASLGMAAVKEGRAVRIVSKNRQWLHFAFDDNRHRAVPYGAKLPPRP